MINAGGLINVYNELIGYNKERALRMARGIFTSVARVLEIAKAERIATWMAADRLAEERIAQVRRMRPRHWDRKLDHRRR